MFNRYNEYTIIANNTEEYRSVLERKKLKILRQYPTFYFNNLKDLKDQNIDFVLHTVQPFEKLYNISQKYYKSPEYGWIILYTNKIKSELEIETGMMLNIYYPIDILLGLL